MQLYQRVSCEAIFGSHKLLPPFRGFPIATFDSRRVSPFLFYCLRFILCRSRLNPILAPTGSTRSQAWAPTPGGIDIEKGSEGDKIDHLPTKTLTQKLTVLSTVTGMVFWGAFFCWDGVGFHGHWCLIMCFLLVFDGFQPSHIEIDERVRCHCRSLSLSLWKSGAQVYTEKKVGQNRFFIWNSLLLLRCEWWNDPQ